MTKNTIGIDFGTTNTYVTICPADNENVVSVRIDSDSKKTPLIPTEILYSDKPNADKNVFPMIGRLAYETYGECDDDEREKEQYRYRATFKPDIVKSADARKCAVDFLQALLREAKKNSKPLNPLDCRVIFGVPAEANKEYRNVLKQIAKEANYGDIETIEEPKGAMLSDLAGGIIPLADMQKGYLVIDFGGGTCDFAFLQNGAVRHSWGDMHLGGRLLDDLFWQWFCDENPSLKQQLIQTGEDFYCRTVQCRELKEWFSDQLIAVPNYYGKKKVGNTGGRITTLCKDEFERRARSYQPSPEFFAFQKLTGIELPDTLTNGTPIDYIQWFADEATRGLREEGIHPKDITVVSLAGGSSCWYFVADCCRGILKKDDIRKNNEPFAAISQGIAKYPAIEKEFADRRKRIDDEKPTFIENEILSHVRSVLEDCSVKIADEVIATLFDEEIEPLLLDFRSNGGIVSALEKNVEEVVDAYKPQLNQMVNTTLSAEFATLQDTAQRKLSKWIKESGFRLPDNLQEIETGELGDLKAPDVDPLGDILALGGIAGAITAVLGAFFLATGPIGWILGIILASASAFAFGIDSKDIHIPSWMLSLTLTDEKITEMRTKMYAEIKDSVRKESNDIIGKIESDMDNLIQQEVERLSILNVM